MRVVIRNGKVNGRPIIRAWESFTGWLYQHLDSADAGEQAEQADAGESNG